MSEFLSKEEKIQVSLKIYESLKKYELFDSKYEAINILKTVVNQYIESSDTRTVRGEIKFPEASKVIVYRLPSRKGEKDLVVLEHRPPYFFNPK